MQKIYKKLLFDLDNTLVDDDENRKYAIKQILIERKENVTDEKIEKFINLDNEFWKDRAEGKIKDPYEFKTNEEKAEWVRSQRFIKYFNNISFEEAIEINKKYINFLSKNIVPIKDSQEILKYLYEKQYELYITTNGPTKIVNDKLNKIESRKYIKGVYTAEEAGHMKPHNEFFKNFFQKINSYDKDNMLIIGDKLDEDVLGGVKNGIDSCWFNMKNIVNSTDFKPTYEINSLIELKNIL